MLYQSKNSKIKISLSKYELLLLCISWKYKNRNMLTCKILRLLLLTPQELNLGPDQLHLKAVTRKLRSPTGAAPGVDLGRERDYLNK